MTYPETPGFKVEQAETSRRAAAEFSQAAKTLREKCFESLRGAAMTADEVAELIGASVLAVRPRISELRAQGKVFPTDKRRCNVSGKKAAVWRAAIVVQQEELKW